MFNKPLIKVGCVVSGLVSLYVKSLLPGSEIVYCLQELASAGKSNLSRVSKTPKYQSINITQNKKT